MTRIARVVAVGLPHHITQRGNYQQEVFTYDSERERYLRFVSEYGRRFGARILSYCLMPNHVHFIAIPLNADSLAKTFNSAHMRYSQYFNRKRKMAGHLWQGRFYSCVLDQKHLTAAARYVERNPVRAGLAEAAEAWQWSSASAHCQGRDGSYDFDLSGIFGLAGIEPGGWSKFLAEPGEAGELSAIRSHTMTGRPLGDGMFVGRLEALAGRRLHALPHGRPKLQ